MRETCIQLLSIITTTSGNFPQTEVVHCYKCDYPSPVIGLNVIPSQSFSQPFSRDSKSDPEYFEFVKMKKMKLTNSSHNEAQAPASFSDVIPSVSQDMKIKKIMFHLLINTVYSLWGGYFFDIMLKCTSANIDLEACQPRYAFDYSWASLIASFYHDSLSVIFHDGHTVRVTLEGYVCVAFRVDSPKLLIISVSKAQARANAKAISLIDVLSTLP